mmetsp:Transcript_78518/g.220058  ORF Transcript_78518/g.220058 Transcript_78518/m.220058 type:complete len:329 (-) Transcript_78518:173-1159(-)
MRWRCQRSCLPEFWALCLARYRCHDLHRFGHRGNRRWAPWLGRAGGRHQVAPRLLARRARVRLAHRPEPCALRRKRVVWRGARRQRLPPLLLGDPLRGLPRRGGRGVVCRVRVRLAERDVHVAPRGSRAHDARHGDAHGHRLDIGPPHDAEHPYSPTPFADQRAGASRGRRGQQESHGLGPNVVELLRRDLRRSLPAQALGCACPSVSGLLHILRRSRLHALPAAHEVADADARAGPPSVGHWHDGRDNVDSKGRHGIGQDSCKALLLAFCHYGNGWVAGGVRPHVGDDAQGRGTAARLVQRRYGPRVDRVAGGWAGRAGRRSLQQTS